MEMSTTGPMASPALKADRTPPTYAAEFADRSAKRAERKLAVPVDDAGRRDRGR